MIRHAIATSQGNRRSWTLQLCSTILIVFSGCEPVAVTGGTSGHIHCAGQPLTDIQVTVHRVSAGGIERIGLGVSNLQGDFALVQPAASGPLWLEPGKYRLTIESVGPVSLNWPAEFADAHRTPLVRTWTAADVTLDVNVPQPTTRP